MPQTPGATRKESLQNIDQRDRETNLLNQRNEKTLPQFKIGHNPIKYEQI